MSYKKDLLYPSLDWNNNEVGKGQSPKTSSAWGSLRFSSSISFFSADLVPKEVVGTVDSLKKFESKVVNI